MHGLLSGGRRATIAAMLLTEIDHVAIAVNDLDAAIDYYERAFGATVDREVVERDGVEEALLKVADSYVQLIKPTRPDSPVAKALEKRGEGLHHIGYRVNDCGEALAAMVAAGATPIDQAPRPGQPGHDGRLHPPEGQLRDTHRAGAGVVLTTRYRPGPGKGPAGERSDRRSRTMTLTTQTMTDEQRKSVAMEYLRAFDKGGVTSTGDCILSTLRRDAQVYFPKWGLANGKEEIGKMFGDVGGTLKSIVHHYSHFNWIMSGCDPSCARAPATASTRTAPWRAGSPEWRAGRWCDVFEIRDFLIQRCFIYLDPDYAGKDTARYPGSRRADAASAGPNLAAWAREGPPHRRHVRTVPTALRPGDAP